MNIRFAILAELSFDDLQTATLTLLASEDTLAILTQNYKKFIALGFDNAQIVELATLHGGTALSIILNRANQFDELYALTDLYSSKFTISDVVSIAKNSPSNLDILFENICFLNYTDELTIKKFIECLSGNKSDVERLMKIIEDMLLSLMPTTEQTPLSESEAAKDPESNVQSQGIIRQRSIGSLMQNCPSTVLLQQTFLISNELGSNKFETGTVLLDSPTQMKPSLKAPAWFLSEMGQHRQTNYSDPLNLIFIGKNNVAKVITQAQLNDIKKDIDGNLFIEERNLKLMLLPANLIPQNKKAPFELFRKISICLTIHDQYIGVVFNSDISYGSIFKDCNVITSGTLMRWVKDSVGEKQAYLNEQLDAARKMCELILTKADVKKFRINREISRQVHYWR